MLSESLHPNRIAARSFIRPSRFGFQIGLRLCPLPNSAITGRAGDNGFIQRNGWFGRHCRQTVKLSDFVSHTRIVIMTFLLSRPLMIKLINSKVFNKKVGIIFCNRHQFLVFETDNISLKVGITFFSECVKSAILLKNEFSHFAFLNKSSILNGLSKTLSRLFTAIASLEKFINGRKVTHIITTFFRGNGANTTFLVKSHDTKKVGITNVIKNY